MITQPYWENMLYVNPQPIVELIPNSQWFRFCSKAIAQTFITANLTGGTNPLSLDLVLQDETSITFPMAVHVSTDDVGVWVITGTVNGMIYDEYVGELIDRQTNPNSDFDPNVDPKKPMHLIANIVAPGYCELRWSN